MERTQPIDSFLVSCNLRKNYKLDTEPQKIAGSDIMEGNQTLTLALVWQLMRAYTLSLLSKLNEDGTPIVESEIISWANNKVASHYFSTELFRSVKIIWSQKNYTITISKSLEEITASNTFTVDGGWEELTDQAFPRQDKQDGAAHHRPDRRHEDWRHRLCCRQEWLKARWRG